MTYKNVKKVADATKMISGTNWISLYVKFKRGEYELYTEEEKGSHFLTYLIRPCTEQEIIGTVESLLRM